MVKKGNTRRARQQSRKTRKYKGGQRFVTTLQRTGRQFPGAFSPLATAAGRAPGAFATAIGMSSAPMSTAAAGTAMKLPTIRSRYSLMKDPAIRLTNIQITAEEILELDRARLKSVLEARGVRVPPRTPVDKLQKMLKQ